VDIVIKHLVLIHIKEIRELKLNLKKRDNRSFARSSEKAVKSAICR